MRTFTAILAGLLIYSCTHAQTRVVSGDLTVFNNYGVQNINITSKKAKSSVTTDSQGHFELVYNEKDIILVEGSVFEPLTGRVSKKDDYFTVNLVFLDTPENRRIATGKGYISKEALTFALANLQDENNDFCNYTDIFSLVKGKFTGVEVKASESGDRGSISEDKNRLREIPRPFTWSTDL